MWDGHSQKRGYRLFQCRNCGHIQVWPLPSQQVLSRLYSPKQEYFTAKDINLATTSNAEAKRMLTQCSKMLKKPGRALEIGSNNGELLYHLCGLGWKVFGIEVNRFGVEIAMRHGIQTFHGVLEDARLDEECFDLVIVNDVIEHLTMPNRTINIISKLLRPGGIVIVSTPNANCGFSQASQWLARFTIGLIPWSQSEPPYHLHYFSSRTIAILLKRFGLKPFSFEYRSIRLLRQLGNVGYFDGLKSAYLRMRNLGERRAFWSRLPVAIPGLAGIGMALGACMAVGRVYDAIYGGGEHVTVFAQKLANR